MSRQGQGRCKLSRRDGTLHSYMHALRICARAAVDDMIGSPRPGAWRLAPGGCTLLCSAATARRTPRSHRGTAPASRPPACTWDRGDSASAISSSLALPWQPCTSHAPAPAPLAAAAGDPFDPLSAPIHLLALQVVTLTQKRAFIEQSIVQTDESTSPGKLAYRRPATGLGRSGVGVKAWARGTHRVWERSLFGCRPRPPWVLRTCVLRPLLSLSLSLSRASAGTDHHTHRTAERQGARGPRSQRPVSERRAQRCAR